MTIKSQTVANMAEGHPGKNVEGNGSYCEIFIDWPNSNCWKYNIGKGKHRLHILHHGLKNKMLFSLEGQQPWLNLLLLKMDEYGFNGKSKK
jgi:hypothetical protein